MNRGWSSKGPSPRGARPGRGNTLKEASLRVRRTTRAYGRRVLDVVRAVTCVIAIVHSARQRFVFGIACAVAVAYGLVASAFCVLTAVRRGAVGAEYVRPTFPRPLGGARERRLATANEYLDRATPAHLVIGIRRTRRRSVGVGIAKIHTIVAAFGGVPRMGRRLVVISVAYRDRSRAVGSGWPCRDIHGPFRATLIRGAPCARTNRAASVLHRSPPGWGGAAPSPESLEPRSMPLQLLMGPEVRLEIPDRSATMPYGNVQLRVPHAHRWLCVSYRQRFDPE